MGDAYGTSSQFAAQFYHFIHFSDSCIKKIMKNGFDMILKFFSMSVDKVLKISDVLGFEKIILDHSYIEFQYHCFFNNNNCFP